ncbi:GntR family transcriptional regulator [Candidatus Leptofilum sp.]|uniref:GntR family transcriptional regulator n=1 Tax=Candidatus Leptofilum sp. TaxID=3241576 RepID=UPI003B5943EC
MISTIGMPRYIQARETLSARIKAGELQPGNKLPSEDQLAAQFGVSRMTIRKSLDDLIAMGLIYRRHGVGTFVSQSTVQRDHTKLTDFFESCRLSGHTPEVRLLKKEIIPANEKMAEALGLKLGSSLIRLATLRLIDQTPITYHDAYLPVKLFPDLVHANAASLNLDSQHVWQMIEKMGFNVANVVERLEAQIADEQITSILALSETSAILYGERVLYSDDGTPLKYADCYNRGDRFSLTVVLER